MKPMGKFSTMDRSVTNCFTPIKNQVKLLSCPFGNRTEVNWLLLIVAHLKLPYLLGESKVLITESWGSILSKITLSFLFPNMPVIFLNLYKKKPKG